MPLAGMTMFDILLVPEFSRQTNTVSRMCQYFYIINSIAIASGYVSYQNKRYNQLKQSLQSGMDTAVCTWYVVILFLVQTQYTNQEEIFSHIQFAFLPILGFQGNRNKVSSFSHLAWKIILLTFYSQCQMSQPYFV